MEKKKMTNKKKFWIGMSSLAAVGIITATVAYFTSVHVFQPDTLGTLNYKVSAQRLLDESSSQNLTPNKAENMDVIVKNEGDVPILARVYYRDSYNTSVKLEDEELSKKWKFDFAPNNKFEYNTDDKAYYYKGIINGDSEGDGESAQHLDAVTYVGTGEEVTEYTTDGGVSWSDEAGGTINGRKKTYTVNDKTSLTVIVETIQATDKDGNALTISDNIGVAALKNYWAELGKGNLEIPEAT